MEFVHTKTGLEYMAAFWTIVCLKSYACWKEIFQQFFISSVWIAKNKTNW